VIDTDVIAREVVAPGSEGLGAVREAFGDEVLDESGGLDRKAMRERVYADPEERKRLEAIVHPLVQDEARRQIREAVAGPDRPPYVLLVVPLLIESGLFSDADRVLVVDVPEQTQIDRLVARDGIPRQQAESILAAQTSRSKRLARADDTIDNTGSLAELDAAVEELDRMYRGSA